MFVIHKRLIGLLSVAVAVTACSQAPKSELAKQPSTLLPQFGTRNEDSGDHVFVSKQTSAVYVIGGVSRTIDNGSVTKTNTDGFLRRYDQSGTLVWKKFFNATTYEGLSDLAEDSQGNIVVALGKNSGDSEGTSELFKYTSTGQELWHRSLEGVRVVFSLDTTPTGEFYIVGDDSDFRTLIRKYDQDGTLLWAKRLAENASFGPSATDAHGNFYTTTGDEIYKLDQTGKLVWTRIIPKGTADSIYIREIVVDQDSLLLLGGKEWILKADEYEYESEFDVTVTKYGLGGKQLWNRSFGTNEGDFGVSVDVDNKHDIYVVAYVNDGKSLVLRKYAPSGRTLSQTTIAKNLGRANDWVNDMVVRQAGELYITGQTGHNLGAGFGGGYLDAFLIRLDGKGKQVWVR